MSFCYCLLILLLRKIQGRDTDTITQNGQEPDGTSLKPNPLQDSTIWALHMSMYAWGWHYLFCSSFSFQRFDTSVYLDESKVQWKRLGSQFTNNERKTTSVRWIVHSDQTCRPWNLLLWSSTERTPTTSHFLSHCMLNTNENILLD